MKKYIRICACCGNTYETDLKCRNLCKPCHHKKMSKTYDLVPIPWSPDKKVYIPRVLTNHLNKIWSND